MANYRPLSRVKSTFQWMKWWIVSPLPSVVCKRKDTLWIELPEQCWKENYRNLLTIHLTSELPSPLTIVNKKWHANWDLLKRRLVPLARLEPRPLVCPNRLPRREPPTSQWNPRNDPTASLPMVARRNPRNDAAQWRTICLDAIALSFLRTNRRRRNRRTVRSVN